MLVIVVLLNGALESGEEVDEVRWVAGVGRGIFL